MNEAGKYNPVWLTDTDCQKKLTAFRTDTEAVFFY